MPTPLPHVAVIVGSNRRESINRKLAQALVKLGASKFEAKIVRIDDLPIYNQDNEGNLPAEVVRFKDEIAKADGVLIVTPEHNRSMPTALKNAIDFLYREWNNKSVGFVGYGGNGGARAVEILRQVVSNVELADVRAQVGLSLFTDFEDFTNFQPGSHHDPTVTLMLDQVIAWGRALKQLRVATGD